MRERKPILSRISRQRKLRLLRQHFSPGCSILEVGSGDGWLSARLREAGFRVTTMDLAGPADIVGDVTRWRELGLQPGSFDAVVAMEVIEHVDCLQALRSLCRENGLIMLSSPHPRWDWVMRLLERLHLSQPRTSEHTNLTDFAAIPLPAKIRRRPLMIHQVAIFINRAGDGGNGQTGNGATGPGRSTL